ncbi:MAG: DUF4397 domain-containing protein [Bacteroidetes bacterium]|uniref:DUF4397 domain-containing protein n=1 Tax=Phnomibacter sp. TaxID=2836217 RepID=UPI002FDEAE44|nr:DUF4397 domain-containing protein [Bacteroidota bacterium]
MRNNLFMLLLAAVGFAGLVSCEKNSFAAKDNIFVEGKSKLKINFFSSYQSNPSFHIKIDGIRVSNLLTYATPFPGGGLNTGGGSYADYLSVEPGTHKVTIARPFTGTNGDSVELASATISIAADKVYSLYLADTAANTISVLAEDNLNSPDSGFCRYRFINLMPDLPEVDLYFGTGATSTTSTKVAGPVKYKELSDYFNVALNSGSVWSIRPAGAAATTTALTSYTSTSSVVNQRVFTISTRGYNAITTSTDPRRRLVSLIYNR